MNLESYVLSEMALSILSSQQALLEQLATEEQSEAVEDAAKALKTLRQLHDSLITPEQASSVEHYKQYLISSLANVDS